MKKALITGCNGLIGSQAVDFFIEKGFTVIGIDNDMRSYFFGDKASTTNVGFQLSLKHKDRFKLHSIDIRHYEELRLIFEEYSFDIIIHTAAQPSHDWAAKEPITDFSVNALGTLNLLELTRIYSKNAVFIFTSTNKVYGDRPNSLLLKEKKLRFEYDGQSEIGCSFNGITENMSIDNTLHSVFGASKVSADIMCQEYGKYFNMNVGVFRGGCLTGPNHQGAQLHGFLSYLVKCIINDVPYTIFGYKGKQVRDNIHSYDLVNMFWHFYLNPKQGEVYNAGGGRENSLSVLESISMISYISKKTYTNFTISETNRIGDHIWYITDYSKFKKDYPEWTITYPIEKILEEMINNEINNKTNGILQSA